MANHWVQHCIFNFTKVPITFPTVLYQCTYIISIMIGVIKYWDACCSLLFVKSSSMVLSFAHFVVLADRWSFLWFVFYSLFRWDLNRGTYDLHPDVQTTAPSIVNNQIYSVFFINFYFHHVITTVKYGSWIRVIIVAHCGSFCPRSSVGGAWLASTAPPSRRRLAPSDPSVCANRERFCPLKKIKTIVVSIIIRNIKLD